MEAIQGWYASPLFILKPLLIRYRLLKAEAIYDDSGCSAIGRFSKCCPLFVGVSVLILRSAGFPRRVWLARVSRMVDTTEL